MPNSIVILRKVFKFEVNPISRSSSIFFSSEKNILCCHSRCLSVRLFVRLCVSVCLCTFVCPSCRPSVSVISFRGNLKSSRHGHDLCFNLILLKIDVHLHFMVMYVQKNFFFKITIGSCKFMQLAI